MRITPQQYLDMQKTINNKQKPLKYNNEKRVVDGEKFDSKKEADYYGKLLLLQKQGEISNLKRQVPFDIVVNDMKICRYIADFTYLFAGHEVVVDVKSIVTRKLPVYRIKKKLIEAIYGIKIKEV